MILAVNIILRKENRRGRELLDKLQTPVYQHTCSNVWSISSRAGLGILLFVQHQGIGSTDLLQGLVVYEARCIFGDFELPLLNLLSKLPRREVKH